MFLLCRLAGFFNEQPQIMAQFATSPSVGRSPAPGRDVELAQQLQLAAAAGGNTGGSNGRFILTPSSLDTALSEASGRSEGLSSPVLRENKALHGIGTLGAALEAELSRVAAWRQTKWEARGKGWATQSLNNNGNSTTGATSPTSREEREPLILGDTTILEEK